MNEIKKKNILTWIHIQKAYILSFVCFNSWSQLWFTCTRELRDNLIVFEELESRNGMNVLNFFVIGHLINIDWNKDNVWVFWRKIMEKWLDSLARGAPCRIEITNNKLRFSRRQNCIEFLTSFDFLNALYSSISSKNNCKSKKSKENKKPRDSNHDVMKDNTHNWYKRSS